MEHMNNVPFIRVHGTRVFAPRSLGFKDLLLGAGKILALLEPGDPFSPPGFSVQQVEATGMMAFPGFVDGHVHLIGGGGEGGFSTRTPEGNAPQFLQAGTTTVIGLLGTDGITRDLSSLLAKVRGLREEGLHAYMLTGNYRYPPKTMTGDLLRDIVWIPEIIGFGELAVSDHRGSHITATELQRLAMDCRLGGMLSGKTTRVVLHMGGAPSGLEPLRQALEDATLPPAMLVPTHIDRTPTLLEEGVEWVQKHQGKIDFTADDQTAKNLCALLDRGVNAHGLMVSSDGLGSLPVFDDAGNLLSLTSSPVDGLWKSFCQLVREHGVPVETALLPFCWNVAECFGLLSEGVGTLKPGGRADFILADENFRLQQVFHGGNSLLPPQ